MEKNIDETVEPITPADLQEDTTEKLSLRDALEVAYEAKQDAATSDSRVGEVDTGVSAGASAGTDAGGDKPSASESAQELPPLEPPAEFTRDEQDDFRQLSRKQQEAQLRLHKSRMSRLGEIKTATEEYKFVKDLARQIEPYVKARGHKETAEIAMQKAVALYLETVNNPKASAAAILRAKGLPVPRELIDEESRDPVQEKLAPLEQKIQTLESKLAQEEHQKAATVLNSVWDSFEQAKNAAGTLRFPDASGPSGFELASKIGSLVSGQTPLSQQFIETVRSRNPNANIETLLTEAYRFYGGRVDDSAAPPNTLTPQKHLIKSNRAASSVPGRGASSTGGKVIRYKTSREALEAAVRDLAEG